MTRVLGLDLSLTAAGYACPTCGTGVIRFKGRGMERLAHITREVLGHALQHPDRADVAILEGYFIGIQGGAVIQLAELGGIVRLALWEAGVPFVVIPPSTLKKFATGKGVATKDKMLAAAIRAFGFQGDENNEADAHLLAATGNAHYDNHLGMHAYQVDALKKVEWPELVSANA